MNSASVFDFGESPALGPGGLPTPTSMRTGGGLPDFQHQHNQQRNSMAISSSSSSNNIGGIGVGLQQQQTSAVSSVYTSPLLPGMSPLHGFSNLLPYASLPTTTTTTTNVGAGIIASSSSSSSGMIPEYNAFPAPKSEKTKRVALDALSKLQMADRSTRGSGESQDRIFAPMGQGGMKIAFPQNGSTQQASGGVGLPSNNGGSNGSNSNGGAPTYPSMDSTNDVQSWNFEFSPPGSNFLSSTPMMWSSNVGLSSPDLNSGWFFLVFPCFAFFCSLQGTSTHHRSLIGFVHYFRRFGLVRSASSYSCGVIYAAQCL